MALAFIFRINKAAALLGSVLTNTWLSIVTFVSALKIGAAITGVHWADVQQQAHDLMDHFSWKDLWGASFASILKPLLIGYAVVGVLCGAAAYLAVLLVLRKRGSRRG